MIISGPGIEKSRRSPRLTSLVDLVPTILESIGRKDYYDLVADGGEHVNLYPRPEALALEQRLDPPLPAALGAPPPGPPAEMIETLKALGYL